MGEDITIVGRRSSDGVWEGHEVEKKEEEASRSSLVIKRSTDNFSSIVSLL